MPNPAVLSQPSPERDDAHELMHAWLAAQVPKLYAGENEKDPLVRAKYFTPDSSWTWYLLEFDGKDTCFGLVYGFERELGYFTLSELRSTPGPRGLPIERDLYFSPIRLSKLP